MNEGDEETEVDEEALAEDGGGQSGTLEEAKYEKTAINIFAASLPRLGVNMEEMEPKMVGALAEEALSANASGCIFPSRNEKYRDTRALQDVGDPASGSRT